MSNSWIHEFPIFFKSLSSPNKSLLQSFHLDKNNMWKGWPFRRQGGVFGATRGETLGIRAVLSVNVSKDLGVDGKAIWNGRINWWKAKSQWDISNTWPSKQNTAVCCVTWLESMACHGVSFIKFKRVRFTPCSNKKGLSFHVGKLRFFNVHSMCISIQIACVWRLQLQNFATLCMPHNRFISSFNEMTWTHDCRMAALEELLPVPNWWTFNHVEAHGHPKGAVVPISILNVLYFHILLICENHLVRMFWYVLVLHFISFHLLHLSQDRREKHLTIGYQDADGESAPPVLVDQILLPNPRTTRNMEQHVTSMMIVDDCGGFAKPLSTLEKSVPCTFGLSSLSRVLWVGKFWPKKGFQTNSEFGCAGFNLAQKVRRLHNIQDRCFPKIRENSQNHPICS